jgi:hypothetical protein
MKSIIKLTSLAIILGIIILMGCKKNNSLAGFSPEITNLPDNFQLQATSIVDVSTTITYNWTNSGPKANIDLSGVITSGSGTLTIKDANGTQVYTTDIKATGSSTSTAGIAGSWKIVLLLTKANGNLNFRVQKGG